MTSSPLSSPGSAPAPPAWQEFRDRRGSSLSAPHGILAQVALHWIDPEVDGQGFDALPGRWRITEDGLEVCWEGEDLHLLVDPEDAQVTDEGSRHRAVLSAPGDVRLAHVGEDVHVDVIRRGGRTGLRMLDPSAPRRTGFTGVPTYPYDPNLVVRGTWREQPAEVRVGSALPWLEQHLPSPGIARLEIEGVAVELVLTGRSSLLFTDETSGSTSADWRVVEAELDGDEIRVDFNRAVNFPAAFSTWATCPRPPAGNHLPLPIRAGEKQVERTRR
jgi:uncharacterized protein